MALAISVAAKAQQAEPGQNQATPQSADRNREAGESSSRDTRTDISPPKDDAKNHPFSSSAVADEEGTAPAPDTTGVDEMHPFDPHKALKDIEVGDFYFKRKNYVAALDRYKEALIYKQNDAVANYRAAECLEKMKRPEEALPYYQAYLRILPEGPLAKDAVKAVARLTDEDKDQAKTK